MKKIIITALVVSLFSCSSSEETANETPQNSSNPANPSIDKIYVSGRQIFSNGSYTSYISNVNAGTNYGLTSASPPLNDIFVVGSDIYVAGDTSGSGDKAAFWKNDVITILNTSTNPSNAVSIFIKDNDIYVAGYQSVSNKYEGVVWKNGTELYRQSNTNYPIFFTGIFVENSDVYVLGYDESGTSSKKVVKYWKNNIPTTVSDPNLTCTPNHFYVKNGDVYVSVKNNNFATDSWTLWKNTTSQFQVPGNGLSFTAFGSDYYTGGFYSVASGTSTISKACYWKNSNRVDLFSSASTESKVNDVYSSNSYVYFAGYEKIDGKKQGKIWRLNPTNNEITVTTVFESGHEYVLEDIFVTN